MIVFASSLGRWIDEASSRIKTLLTTITVNRIAAGLAYTCWLFVLNDGRNKHGEEVTPATSSTTAGAVQVSPWRAFALSAFLALSIIERLSRLANLLCIERDWVPTIALEKGAGGQHAEFDLSKLNAAMGRIDLICKLMSPIFISGLMSIAPSYRLVAVLLAAVNFATWPLEFWTARMVWNANDSLKESKNGAVLNANQDKIEGAWSDFGTLATLARLSASLLLWISAYAISLLQYVSSEVWMPSLATTALHFSIFTFSGILTVFLVQSGFTPNLIMWGESLSAVFELGSTFVFAWGVQRLSTKRVIYTALEQEIQTEAALEMTGDDSDSDGQTVEDDQSTGASRLGLLALCQMLLCLIPVVPAVWKLSQGAMVTASEESDITPAGKISVWKSSPMAVTLIISLVAASRLGRWTAFLSTQQLAQSCVAPQQRSTFAGTEASLASVFGLGHWLATAVWSRHEDFRWISFGSLIVVFGSTALYTHWLMWRRR